MGGRESNVSRTTTHLMPVFMEKVPMLPPVPLQIQMQKHHEDDGLRGGVSGGPHQGESTVSGR